MSPLPLLFAIYLNDIDSIAEWVKGVWYSRFFGDPHAVDDLCLMSNDPNHVQTMLNKLRAYARRNSLTVNTQKSELMCFNSCTSNLPPLFYDGAQLPYADSFKNLGMVCDRQINLNTAADAALRPFTAGTFCI